MFNTKKIMKIGSLCLVLSSTHLFAKPFIEDIKDLNLTTPEYEYLNPLTGFVWVEGGMVANYGELAKDSPLKKLINILFRRAEEFIPSTSEGGIANYLTPYMVGEILGLTAGYARSTTEKAFVKLGVDQMKISLNEHVLRDGRKLEDTNATKKGVRKKLRSVLKILHANHRDSRFYAVLLALLWDKAKNRSDIFSYYQGVREHLDNQFLQDERFLLFNLRNESYRPWLSKQFKKEDVEDVAEPPPMTEYDKLLYWTYINANDTIPLEHQRHAYVDGNLFPDCGATSLRNFFKIFLDYNGQKPRDAPPGDYDLEVLNKLQALQEVKDFFSKYNTRRSQQTQGARDAWGRITCNKGIVYNKGECEISSSKGGAPNMFVLINKLLFQGSEKAQDWPELGRRIQAARSRAGDAEADFSFGYWQGDQEKKFGNLPFSVLGFSNGFIWHFLKGHFVIEALPKGALGQFAGMADIRGPDGLKKHRALNVYSLYPFGRDTVKNLLTAGEDYIFYTKLENADNLISFYEQARRVLVEKDQVELYFAMRDKRLGDNQDAQRRLFSASPQEDIIKFYETTKGDIKKPKPTKGEFSFLLVNRGKIESAKILLEVPGFHHDAYTDPNTGPLLLGHGMEVTVALFSRDGTKVVTGSGDRTAKIWDVSTGDLLHTFDSTSTVLSASFNHDGTRVVIGSYDKTVKIWDVSTGRELHTIKGHTKGVSSAAFNHDGTKVVTGSWDKTANIWAARTGKVIRNLKGHIEPVLSAAFNHDGTRVLTGSGDNTAKIWDVSTGVVLHTLKGHTSNVFSASFSPDGTKVVTGSKDMTAKIWNASNGKVLNTFKGHAGFVHSASFSPDGTKVVTGSKDMTAKIWNASNGKVLHTLEGHTLGVSSASFSPDGTKVVTASYDNTAKIWDTDTGLLLKLLEGHLSMINSASFSSDGTKLLTGSGDKTAKIWDLCVLIPDKMGADCAAAAGAAGAAGAAAVGGGGDVGAGAQEE